MQSNAGNKPANVTKKFVLKGSRLKKELLPCENVSGKNKRKKKSSGLVWSRQTGATRKDWLS